MSPVGFYARKEALEGEARRSHRGGRVGEVIK
jgi:hypothetical protein